MFEKSEIENLFDQLYHRLYPNLLFYATQFLTESEAEDVVQEAFVELWKRRYTLDMGDQISAYLYKLVYNKSLNVIKHNKVRNRNVSLLDEINDQRMLFFESENHDISKHLESKEMRKQIKEAIDSLPDQCRKIFKMSYLHQMKNKEIAELLEISLRTVEAHMYKALKTLRERLKYLLYIVFLFYFQ